MPRDVNCALQLGAGTETKHPTQVSRLLVDDFLRESRLPAICAIKLGILIVSL